MFSKYISIVACFRTAFLFSHFFYCGKIHIKFAILIIFKYHFSGCNVHNSTLLLLFAHPQSFSHCKYRTLCSLRTTPYLCALPHLAQPLVPSVLPSVCMRLTALTPHICMESHSNCIFIIGSLYLA